MVDDLDFNADEFTRMTTAQKARICKLLAARAREIALRAAPESKASYLRIADEWDNLASEIEEQD